jgi:hypothetical protein
MLRNTKKNSERMPTQSTKLFMDDKGWGSNLLGPLEPASYLIIPMIHVGGKRTSNRKARLLRFSAWKQRKSKTKRENEIKNF